MSYKLNYTTEEKIKLAKDNSIDQIYDSRKNQRAVRVITVFVSISFHYFIRRRAFNWRLENAFVNVL